MKKFRIILWSALAAGALFVFVVAACSSGKHVLKQVNAAAATCETAGNEAYYTCSHCDKLFADENGEREVTLSEVTIVALNHLYDGYEKDAEGHWQVCTREGCGHQTEKVEHVPDSLDWGKTDQTCSDCGYILHEKLFTAIEELQQITISKNMSGSSTVTTRQAGNYTINTETGDISGNFYNFTGTVGQYIIITGGGITGTGAGTPRAVYGMYFKNYGESAFTFKYYLENNKAIPATTEMITLQPGELRYVEMVANVNTFTSTPYSRIELGADATDAKLALAGFKVGTLADGAFKLSLPQNMTFSDGTTEKYVTTALGNELLATLEFTVPQGALGFYNEFDNSFWLADEGGKVTPVMSGDAALSPLTATGEWTAKKVQPRATGASNGNAITVSNGIDPSGTGAGTVSTAGEGGDTETCVLYSVNAQNAGVNVVAGCGSFLSKSTSLRLAKITVTRVLGEIKFKHYVGNIGAGTALTTFDANLNAGNDVVEYCFLIPANLDMGDSKHVIFNILEDMQDSASFTMQCSVINVI